MIEEYTDSTDDVRDVNLASAGTAAPESSGRESGTLTIQEFRTSRSRTSSSIKECRQARQFHGWRDEHPLDQDETGGEGPSISVDAGPPHLQGQHHPLDSPSSEQNFLKEIQLEKCEEVHHPTEEHGHMKPLSSSLTEDVTDKNKFHPTGAARSNSAPSVPVLRLPAHAYVHASMLRLAPERGQPGRVQPAEHDDRR